MAIKGKKTNSLENIDKRDATVTIVIEFCQLISIKYIRNKIKEGGIVYDFPLKCERRPGANTSF